MRGARQGRSVRVAIASRLYAPEPAAAALRLRGLARALAERGAQVTVLTSTPPGMQPPHDPGITVRSARALRNANGYILGYLPYLSFDLPLLARLLAGSRPDLIIAEPPPTTGCVVRLVAAVRRVPYVYYAADVWSDASSAMNVPRMVVRALRLVERTAMSGATRVLAVSDGVSQRVRDLTGMPAERVMVVPNGIDTDTFTTAGPTVEAMDAGQPGPAGCVAVPDGPYFLYAGTASSWQGVDVFVDAVRIVHRSRPDVSVVFLGQGSDWEQLEAAARRDARVVVGHRVPAEQAAAWQRGAVASLVSIKPGQGYDFAYPTKILAALACGTPVVYAGPGPARAEITDAALGWAVDYDAKAVAHAMMAALDAAEQEAQAGTRPAQRERRRAWVVEHRSMRTELGRAAQALVADIPA